MSDPVTGGGIAAGIAALLGVLRSWVRVNPSTFTPCNGRIETKRGIPFSRRYFVHLTKGGKVNIKAIRDEIEEARERRAKSAGGRKK